MVDAVLRPAAAEDIDDVAAIHLASRAAAAMPPAVHPDHEAKGWLASRLAAGDELWVAEVDGAPAAYARFTLTWLDDLYVRPEHAGHGLGGALLDLVKSRLSNGFSLWVFEMNTPARGFYRRHGLVELERTDGAGNEEKAPDIRMAWPGADGLSFYRRQIDEVDEHLGDLLARRAALTRAVQQVKEQGERDPSREREIAAAVAARAPALGEERVARIVHTIITESLDAARSD